MPGRWSLELLGGARLSNGEGRAVPAKGVTLERKAAGMLYYLAREGATPRSALAGLLWPEREEKRARNSLRQLLHKLREYDGLVVGGDPVRLGEGVEVDAVTLLHLTVRREYAALLERWPDGPSELLAGYHYDDCPDFEAWLQLEREHLRDALRQVLEAEAERCEKQGDYRAALPLARRLVALDPLSEVGQRRLMRLYALSGDRAAALAAYQRYRDVLARTLGVEPEAETRELATALERGTLALRRDRLPTPVTPFVGRDAELAELSALLARPECRLLTLTGPGGIGKTRLAIELARRQADAFPDGVVFVPLADVDHPARLVHAVAAALDFGFYQQDAPERQLLAHVQHKRLLLLFDTFEHLHAATALLVDLLRYAPEVKLLVTSRHRLRLANEFAFGVGGLAVPSGDESDLEAEPTDAVTLFVQAATRADATLTFTPADLRTAARICRALEGFPLAIELAAAWCWALTLDEIEAGLDERLAFLQADAADLPPRHRSLRAAFDHSWRLLDAAEQRALAGLSVFRGGFDRDAARRAADVAMRTLVALMGRSLVVREANGRFVMHGLMREYAEEKARQMGSWGRSCEAHARYYLELLHREVAEHFHGPSQGQALERLTADLPNLLAAWRHATSLHLPAVGRASRDLMLFFDARGDYHLGARLFVEAAERYDPHDPADRRPLGRIQIDRSWLLFRLGRYDEAGEVATEGLALLHAKEKEYRAKGLFTLGNAALRSGDVTAAEAFLGDALALARAEGNEPAIASLLNSLGILASDLGDYDRARQYYREASALNRKLGSRLGLAHNVSGIGSTLLDEGRAAEAAEAFAEALAIARELGDRGLMITALANLGEAYGELGEHEQARLYLERALALAEKSRTPHHRAHILGSLGRLAVATDALPQAHRYLQESLRLGWQHQELPVVLRSLAFLAELLERENEAEEAASLWRLLVRHPSTPGPVRRRARDRLQHEARADLAAPSPAAELERLLVTRFGFAPRHGVPRRD